MKRLLFIACFIGCIYMAVNATSYPRIVETEKWVIASYVFSSGEFRIGQCYKLVDLSPSSGIAEEVFYSIRIAGAVINGTQRSFSGAIGSITKIETGLYTSISATIDVTGVTPHLKLAYYFYKDGRLLISALLDSPSSYMIQVPIKFDYDLAGSSNDVIEIPWNKLGTGLSYSPPEGVADLYYVSPYLSGDANAIDTWSAVSNQFAYSFPQLSNTLGPSVSRDYTALCKIADARGPHSEFGMIFWAWGNEYKLVAKSGDYSWQTQPVPNVNYSIQTCGAAAPGFSQFPRYAYSGQDQQLYIVVKGNSNTYTPIYLAGKLYQKPNGRPIKIDVHEHPNLIDNDNGVFHFNPDQLVKSVNGENRTFRTAFAHLSGNTDLVDIRVSTVLNDVGVPSGGTIANNELFNYCNYHRDFTSASLLDITNHKIDLFVLDWTFPGGGGWAPDFPANTQNNISGEWAAVSWVALRQRLNASGQWYETISGVLQQKKVYVVGAHEIGHCLKFPHNWRGSGTIMSPTDPDQASFQMRFNDVAPKDLPRHYKTAPEGWIRPGRYGASQKPGDWVLENPPQSLYW